MHTYQFLLKQHIGASAVAVVQVGQCVRRGERIAENAPCALGSCIHSSVNGKVVSIEENSITIEQDRKSEDRTYVKLRGETPLQLVEEAGIVGLGGAGFPTYAKLGRPLQPGGTVIVNAAECEPILCHNIHRIEKNANQVVRGLRIAMDIVGAQRGIVALKEKNASARQAMQRSIAGTNIELCLLSDLYPMGEERAVIREALRKLLDVGELPIAANCVVLNAETAYRVYQAVEERKPLIDKDVTVAGKLSGELIQVFLDVPIGTRVSSLIERAGGCGEYGELIMGGPFTGSRTTLDAPVVKTAGGILLAECFPQGPQKIGLLVCACGASEERMKQLARELGSDVAAIEYCKQAQPVKVAYKCTNPGKCPGQVQKVLALKKASAQALLIGNCSDCTNTVMSCAPKLRLPVYHCTDGALRAVNHRLVRSLRE